MLSTAAVGRVWCGWLCPQTIFMEMLFRKIEYLIDGIGRAAAAAGPRRRGRPTRAWRQRRSSTRVFFALSFAIANVFLAYIIGADALWTIVTDPPRQHLAGLIAITIFSLRVLRRVRALPRAGVHAGVSRTAA